MVEVDLVLDRRAFNLDVGLLDEKQRMALVDRLAGLDRDPPHIAARRAPDLVLHLHGVHDQERLAGGDSVALLHGDADDRALHRRRHRHGSFRCVVGSLRSDLGCRLAERQHGQRIDCIDSRASLPRARCGLRCPLEIEPGLQLGGRGDQLLRMLVDEARVNLVGPEIAVCQQGAQEGDVAGRAFQPEGGERAFRARERVGKISRWAVHDHLGEQRVEVGVGAVAGVAIGVDPHARTGWRLEHRERAAARLGRAIRRHGLHVDPELDGMAARLGALETDLGQARTARQLQLRLHQVDAPHFLRHRVLDLQARIGFDEKEIRPVDQELEGAEAAIFNGLGHGDGCVDDLLAQGRLEVGAGRQLDELLAAPLQGAFALAQGDDAALAVAHDLHLDVARMADQPLGIEIAVAEGRFGLGRGARKGVGNLALFLEQPHATPAAAGDGFERDARLCVLLEEDNRAREVDHAGGARQHRHLALFGMGAGVRLVAEQFQLLGCRPDERQLGPNAGLREVGILRQKAVAWMH